MINAGGGVKIELKDFQPIHEKCAKGIKEGDQCDKVFFDKELGYTRCIAYIDPSYWWDRKGNCPLASHTQELSEKEKVRRGAIRRRVGQQKQGAWRRR